MVPCVLYGQGEQTHFSVKRVEMNKIIFSPEVYLVELEIEGKKTKGIIREVQQHPVKDTIQHVDFYELDENKKVRVNLPVRTEGVAKGVLNGGRLNMAFKSLSCYGLSKDIPDAITLDVSSIRIGQGITISEIKIPGVTILDPASAMVISELLAIMQSTCFSNLTIFSFIASSFSRSAFFLAPSFRRSALFLASDSSFLACNALNSTNVIKD